MFNLLLYELSRQRTATNDEYIVANNRQEFKGDNKQK